MRTAPYRNHLVVKIIEMKCKLSLVFFLVAIVLIGHAAATDSAKSREKRSPKPQLGKLLGGFILKWAPKWLDGSQKVYKLIRKNPGKTAAAGAVGAVGVGVIAHQALGPNYCAVHIRSLPELQPVYIKDGTPRSLMVPKDGHLTWAHGETSTIACTSSVGSLNVISGTNSVVETIKCENGLMFWMNGRLQSITSITCDQKVTGNYRDKPDAQCAGTNIAIGFNVPFPGGAQFLDLFYSCFDDTNAAPLYTHHVLLGNEIEHKCIYHSRRPSFKSSGYTAGVAISEAYTQKKQKKRLADLFSGAPMASANAVAEADRYYVRSSLEQGHLTPDADELFTTWQWSTYFYINVAGMWGQINRGNWVKLETKIRKVAHETGENFEIYTGTYGTLALCTSTVQTSPYCPDFTLVDGSVPVPKWLWKIVKVPTGDAAIALVVSNNPFEPVAPICGSQQKNYGWDQIGFDDFQIGKVSYCSVEDLKKVVGYVPQDALAARVLEY